MSHEISRKSFLRGAAAGAVGAGVAASGLLRPLEAAPAGSEEAKAAAAARVTRELPVPDTYEADRPKQTDYSVDVLVVGAGLSGVGASCHLQTRCPGLNYAVIEARETIGGTWDLFRYPGIRSDSDLHTFGYEFKPWRDEESIASAPRILDYLRETITENDLEPHIRFHHKVVGAEWSSAQARWLVDVENPETGARHRLSARWVFSAGGYYRYDENRKRQPDPEVERIILDVAEKMQVRRRKIEDSEILERLLLPMVNEGARILEEGIASRPVDIDVVFVNGFGWPAWRGGPMFWADRMGLGQVRDKLARYAEATNDANLRRMRELTKAKIVARGETITISGEAPDVEYAGRMVRDALDVVKSGGELTPESLLRSARLSTEGRSLAAAAR